MREELFNRLNADQREKVQRGIAALRESELALMLLTEQHELVSNAALGLGNQPFDSNSQEYMRKVSIEYATLTRFLQELDLIPS